jgi:uncharacterized protein YfkK (UPF0435 family)
VTDHDYEALVEVRDIFAKMHDSRVGERGNGLSPTEMAAIRDSLRRLNEVIGHVHEAIEAKNTETP